MSRCSAAVNQWRVACCVLHAVFLKDNEQFIEQLSVSPLLSEFPLAVTFAIFRGATGKLGMLVIIEVDDKISIVVATLEVSAVFALTHCSSLSLSAQHSSLQC